VFCLSTTPAAPYNKLFISLTTPTPYNKHICKYKAILHILFLIYRDDFVFVIDLLLQVKAKERSIYII
jgi:hypothetical protein